MPSLCSSPFSRRMLTAASAIMVLPTRSRMSGCLPSATPIKKLDAFEKEILSDYETGQLNSTSPSTTGLAKFKAAATATIIKDKRINVRLSAPDLMDIQARAIEEGIPYQTFIATVLHKFAAGRLYEKPSNLARKSTSAS